MIRVLIAANSPVARAGLESVIASEPLLTLAGTPSSLRDLSPELVDELHPDVVLADVDRQENGILADLQPMQREPHDLRRPALVVLAHTERSAELAGVLRLGFGGVLPHEASASEIIAAVQASAAGLLVIHPAFADFLPDLPAVGPASDEPKPSLTPREIEVLNLIAQGLGNKEIAWRLGISEHTVKFHIGSIFTKLDASGRAEAVRLGIRAGLIML